MQPKVSVCCSVLNQSEWLREMIGSLVAQTMKDWELVLVDDGSTEDIKAIVQEFGDSRIRFFRWDENRGIPHGINFAFEQATGEYIKPMAADETLWPLALGLQAKYLDDNPSKAACFGLPWHGELGLRPDVEQYTLEAHNRSRVQWLDTLLNLKEVPLGSCNALWRRSLMAELGVFDTTLKAFVDHEWYCRLVKTHDIHVLPYRVATFRDDPQSISTWAPEKQADTMRQLNYARAKHGSCDVPNNGLVTIAIPVKDMAGYIPHTLDSLLAQTYKNIEIIVVDDGSTDDTAEVVRRYRAENGDGRIHLHIFPENRGDRHACNYAIEHAKGDYFMALSADDTIEPTYLERVLAVFKTQPLLDFCSTQTDFIDEAGKPFTAPHPFKDIEKAANKPQDQWKARLRFGNVYFGAGTYKTQALRDIGGWKQEYGVLSDYAVYLEMLARSNIHVIEEPLTHTRITGKNMSTKFDPQWLTKTYAQIKSRFYPRRRKLVIATPFYSVQGYSPYIYSLTQTLKALTMAGVDWEYWHPSGDAYVHRVKNTIFSKFIEDPEATDLLMIDSDMEWDVAGLLRMLMLPEELIVGSYPQKNAWDLWTSKPHFESREGKLWATQKIMADGGTLIEGEDLAGGFMLVKRGILERYMAAFHELRYIDESADPSVPTRVYTEFFSAGPIDDGNETGIKRFWGEDRAFSRRLKAMNERWWIYASITFGHWGMKGWRGNFGEYLQGRRTPDSPLPPAANETAASVPLVATQ